MTNRGHAYSLFLQYKKKNRRAQGKMIISLILS